MTYFLNTTSLLVEISTVYCCIIHINSSFCWKRITLLFFWDSLLFSSLLTPTFLMHQSNSILCFFSPAFPFSFSFSFSLFLSSFSSNLLGLVYSFSNLIHCRSFSFCSFLPFVFSFSSL